MPPSLIAIALRTAVLVCAAFVVSATPAAAEGQSFFEPGVAQNSFAAIVVAVGKPFDTLGVRITPTELTVDVIPADSTYDSQSWQVSHKGLVAGALGLDLATPMSAGSAVSRIGPIKDSRFAFSAENLAIVPKLVQEAIAKARLDTPGRVTEMELRRLPAIVGEASKTPIWQIHVAGVDEEADFGANLDGKITSSDLRRTHRAERLNLFAGGEDFDDFLARIREETGKAWVFHRIEIEKQDIGLDMHIASDKKAEVQHFNASISEIRSNAFSMPHIAFMGEAADAPFSLADVDFGQLLPIEQAALAKLAIPKGVVTRVAILRPQRENGARIEWTVDVEPSDRPLFTMPGKAEPPKGSATFDGKGAFLRAVYPKGDGRQANLLDAAELKRAFAEIANELGAHEPLVEANVSSDSIELRAADPNAPAKLVSYSFRNGVVTRTMDAVHDVAGMLGDGPDWRWDMALLTPDVFDRLPGLAEKSIKANPKPNAVLVGFRFTKDIPFNPKNTEPLIEVQTAVGQDIDTENFNFAGETPAVVSGDAQNGLYVGNQPASGGEDDIQGCEYSDDWPKVIAACTHWLDTHPKDAPRGRAIEVYNRANAHMNLKQWAAAIADYTKALEVDPSYPRPYMNRAYSYLSSGDAVRAAADATKAIALDPKKTFAYTVRALAEERQGKWDAAVADFTVAIGQTNGDAQAYFNRGLAYYTKGDLDHAIGDFSQAFGKDSTRADALVYRGMARRLKGDLDGAIADHAEALQADPRSAAAYFNRGMELYLSGALPKALADLSQAAALAPSEPYVALLLDVAATRSGLPSQLKESSAKIDMAAWPAPAVRLLLQQLTPEALAAAAEDGPPSDKQRRQCEAAFYTGVALARAAKTDAAVAQWRQALATCPKPTPERSYAEVELRAAGATP
jgi:tetratricopeptide (TPR) repeat protein